jgi:hypothetical protein
MEHDSPGDNFVDFVSVKLLHLLFSINDGTNVPP